MRKSQITQLLPSPHYVLGVGILLGLCVFVYLHLPFGEVEQRPPETPTVHFSNRTVLGNSALGNATKVKVLASFSRHTTDREIGLLKDDDFITIIHQVVRKQYASTVKRNLETCLRSMFKYTSTPLHIYIAVEEDTYSIVTEVVEDVLASASGDIWVELLDIEELLAIFPDTVRTLSYHFDEGWYFTGRFWYLFAGLHRVFRVKRIMALDTDIKVRSNILGLYNYFSLFSPATVIGMGYELSPWYHFYFREYKRKHPQAVFGDPPPDGIPGFNGGVCLLHLENMRNSKLYAYLTTRQGIHHLATSFNLTKRLADQDFKTFAAYLYPELVYTLPCTWNRQLCESWREVAEESDVFDKFFRCDGFINIYHGNCGSRIPYDG